MPVQWRVASCPTRVAECPPLHRSAKHPRKVDFGAQYTFEQVPASRLKAVYFLRRTFALKFLAERRL